MARRPEDRGPLLLALRYGLPAVVCTAALVIVVAGGASDDSLEGAAAFIGAGLSIWLINALFRLGLSDQDRDDEEEARRYFDRHGRWPDEPPQ